MYFEQHLVAPGWSRDTEDFALGFKGHIVGKIRLSKVKQAYVKAVEFLQSF